MNGIETALVGTVTSRPGAPFPHVTRPSGETRALCQAPDFQYVTVAQPFAFTRSDPCFAFPAILMDACAPAGTTSTARSATRAATRNLTFRGFHAPRSAQAILEGSLRAR